MNWRKFLPNLLILTAVMLLLGACRQGNTAVTPTAGQPTATPTVTTIPTRTPAPTSTPRPSPTPIVSGLEASAQTVGEDAMLLIDKVALDDSGWVVVYNDVNGEPGDVIGQTAVPFGVSEAIMIQISLIDATATLHVQLHQNLGDDETFDPETDVPLAGAAPVTVMVDIQVERSEIEVSDQTIAEDGLLYLDSVLASQDSWVVIHADDAGEPGSILGVAALPEGLSQQVAVPLRWREASNHLHAILYEDKGMRGQFDPAQDTPELFADEPVMATFTVALPLDFYIMDQPVVDSRLIINRVVVPEPAWAVVSFQEGDGPGLIIGFAALEAGVNENVEIEVIESAVTAVMYLSLHEDTTPGDEFDLPANDPPLVVDGRTIEPFEFRTDPGNYIFTSDQPLTLVDGQAGVLVPGIAVDLGAWVVVQAATEGAPGELLGQLAVDAGVYQDLFVPIDDEAFSGAAFVSLYTNAGDPELFELEEAIDIPFQRNRQPIQAPFSILNP